MCTLLTAEGLERCFFHRKHGANAGSALGSGWDQESGAGCRGVERGRMERVRGRDERGCATTSI